MKKTISIFCILLLIFSMFMGFIPKAEAAIAGRTLAEPSLPVRSEPNSKATRITSIPYNTIIDVLSTDLFQGSGCSEGWYKVRYNGNVGYSCSESISFYVSGDIATEREPVNDYEIVWKEKGFPSGYWESLTALKIGHPNYDFKAINTGIDFSEAVANEAVVGTSLIQVSDLSSSKVAWISTAGGSYNYTTKTYEVLEGSSWYAANAETVAYYMDPRNFFNESRIFMFEDLSYTGTYITETAIQKVFNSFSNLYPHAKAFLDAGVATQINPVYLASLSRQEIGKSEMLVSGGSYIYPDVNKNYPDWIGKEISGVYNFFNYGAGTDARPAYNSLVYAYYQGWTSALAAVTGGANKIGKNYISKGQNTSYFKKYNVKPGATSTTYTHQYMTNIQAPYSESSTSYNTYNSIGVLATDSVVPFVFEIPVYKNMPVKTELPTEVKFLTNYGSTVIDGLLGSTIIKNDGSYLSGFDIGMTPDNILNAIIAVSGEAKVNIYDGAGNIKTSGSLVTGDKVNITYQDESQQYQIVIYGDVSGDGQIDILDLLKVQKHIMEASVLENSYNKAADTNQDGVVNIVDLLRVQKHIVGQIKIVG